MFTTLKEVWNDLNPKERSYLKAGLYGISIAGFISIFILPLVLTAKFWSFINYTSTGGIGDTINGIAGPFIALIAAILTFLAFYIQYKANEQQRHFIRTQSFEDVFFRLLENHQRIVETMDIVAKKDSSKTLAKSRDCFRIMYRFLEKKNKQLHGTDVSITSVNDTYDKIQSRFKSDLHHYFRLLYHILKFIKKSEIEEDEKYKYSNILRAVLSPYEIIFIFYNCLHPFGVTHFKPLVEEFSFLKNIDSSLLLDESHLNEYHPLAFASSKKRKSLIIGWKELQI